MPILYLKRQISNMVLINVFDAGYEIICPLQIFPVLFLSKKSSLISQLIEKTKI